MAAPSVVLLHSLRAGLLLSSLALLATTAHLFENFAHRVEIGAEPAPISRFEPPHGSVVIAKGLPGSILASALRRGRRGSAGRLGFPRLLLEQGCKRVGEPSRPRELAEL